MCFQLCGNSLCLALSCFNTTILLCTKPFHKERVFPVWCGRTWLAAQSLGPSNTFEINWNANCEPELITHHQCWASLMLLRLNGSRTLTRSCGKSSQKGGCCYSSRLMLLVLKWNVHVFGMECVHLHFVRAKFNHKIGIKSTSTNIIKGEINTALPWNATTVVPLSKVLNPWLLQLSCLVGKSPYLYPATPECLCTIPALPLQLCPRPVTVNTMHCSWFALLNKGLKTWECPLCLTKAFCLSRRTRPGCVMYMCMQVWVCVWECVYVPRHPGLSWAVQVPWCASSFWWLTHCLPRHHFPSWTGRKLQGPGGTKTKFSFI